MTRSAGSPRGSARFQRMRWMYRTAFLLLLTVLVPSGQMVWAQADTGSLYYVTDREATITFADDTTRTYVHPGFREPIMVLPGHDDVPSGWLRVRTLDGAHGFIRSDAVSNIWIRVSKSEQTLHVYRGRDLIFDWPTDLGYNFFADKVKRGSAAEPDHWRTPEGEFFVVAKNPQSQFHRAFVLNYPNARNAERGLEEGLISEAEYDAITTAEAQFRVPPMSTALGGFIEIHGDGTGIRSNWTQGCIAITNTQVNTLWDMIQVGTPVLIEP